MDVFFFYTEPKNELRNVGL